MKTYRVCFLVQSNFLSVIMGATENQDGIELKSLDVVEEEVSPKKSHHRYRNGRKDKGIKGPDLVRQLLKGGVALSIKDATREFEKRGFATSSASATLTAMKNQGLVARDDNGNWRLKPKRKTS